MVRLYLDKTIRRPALSLYGDVANQSCLLDTGALISVWCLPLAVFKFIYPDAEKTNYCTTRCVKKQT